MCKKLLLLVIFSILTGCATHSETPSRTLTYTAPINWAERHQALDQVQSWTISGKIGIKQPDSSDSAIINRWQQMDSQFIIELSSTILGIGSTQISGSPSTLHIINNDGETMTSNNPEIALYQQLGWSLPIKHLPYWIKGTPYPNDTSSVTFNKEGDPTGISQSGWQINLSRYQPVEEHRLPGKIKLYKGDVRIILIINGWQL